MTQKEELQQNTALHEELRIMSSHHSTATMAILYMQKKAYSSTLEP